MCAMLGSVRSETYCFAKLQYFPCSAKLSDVFLLVIEIFQEFTSLRSVTVGSVVFYMLSGVVVVTVVVINGRQTISRCAKLFIRVYSLM